MKMIVEKHSILNSKGNRYWAVVKYDDGSYGCSCPAWIYHRGTKANCKHINELLSKQQIDTTATITAIEPTIEPKEITINALDVMNEVKNG